MHWMHWCLLKGHYKELITGTEGCKNGQNVNPVICRCLLIWWEPKDQSLLQRAHRYDHRVQKSWNVNSFICHLLLIWWEPKSINTQLIRPASNALALVLLPITRVKNVKMRAWMGQAGGKVKERVKRGGKRERENFSILGTSCHPDAWISPTVSRDWQSTSSYSG